MLQDSSVTGEGKISAAPATEISEMATTPTAEDLSFSLLQVSPASEMLDTSSVSDVETILVPPYNNSTSNAAEIKECLCPPGPKGDSAPDSFNTIFSFDETRGILKIDATTIELSGNLVINGFTGVKQSLFIGGDPSSGSPSTEVAAGKLLVYGSEEQGPMITAFSAGESGFSISKLTVEGELFEDPKGLGQAKRVSTGLF